MLAVKKTTTKTKKKTKKKNHTMCKKTAGSLLVSFIQAFPEHAACLMRETPISRIPPSPALSPTTTNSAEPEDKHVALITKCHNGEETEDIIAQRITCNFKFWLGKKNMCLPYDDLL